MLWLSCLFIFKIMIWWFKALFKRKWLLHDCLHRCDGWSERKTEWIGEWAVCNIMFFLVLRQCSSGVTSIVIWWQVALVLISLTWTLYRVSSFLFHLSFSSFILHFSSPPPLLYPFYNTITTIATTTTTTTPCAFTLWHSLMAKESAAVQVGK